ncbi:MAG: Type IV secretion system protein VirB11 [Steroidobacteraceae bacterium]|nr:Type IV secretion system protein VirB11 [Steroidobacteraceae bacterium]
MNSPDADSKVIVLPLAVATRSSLEVVLEPIRALLDDPQVRELCINRPGELFLERAQGWVRQDFLAGTFEWGLRFAKLVANASRQRVDETSPLLSASLPSGERVQLAIPPVTPQRTVAISIRRPSSELWSLEQLAARGIFRRTRLAGAEGGDHEEQLSGSLRRGDFETFMREAVRARQNIIVSGPTGSGKTTWTKALIQEIAPCERLITIEDAPELILSRHPNHVRLFYSKDDQGRAQVTPKQLLEACLRMKPDRILLAELRSEEAFDYLRNANSGHPGSITSVHASSAELAFEQLTLLVKESPGGRELSRRDIKHLLHHLIDIVIQFGIEGHERVIKEIWYAPERRAARLRA